MVNLRVRFLAIVVLLWGSSIAAAHASCPVVATVQAFAPDENGTLYALALASDTAQSSGGTIAASTKSGYYALTFPPTTFRAKGNAFVSAPLYVRLPSAATGWWVTRTQTAGGPAIACSIAHADPQPPAVALAKIAPEIAAPRLDPSAVLSADLSNAPDFTDCAIENADVSVMKAVQPAFPLAETIPTGSAMVLVLVHVDASGTVTAAKITQSSHDLMIDNAAVKAATQSIYRPKYIDCIPVQGTYLFRADFSDS